jgi:broad specificity phosphatase PhoE
VTARRVLLIRHTAVAEALRGTCYGARDVPLAPEGRAAARALAVALPADDYDLVAASPLRRARLLGGLLARRRGVPLLIDPRLAERGFGTWEGRSWDAIHARVGDAMNGIIDAPGTYRPGGGETTAELARRALSWFLSLPDGAAVLAAAHGGPIGALAGTLLGEPPRAWLAHVPPQGGGLLIERDGTGHAIRHLVLSGRPALHP